MRLFLVANILFSAAWREDSAARLLWDLASTDHCELLSSRLGVEQARRNMQAQATEPKRQPGVLDQQRFRWARADKRPSDSRRKPRFAVTARISAACIIALYAALSFCRWPMRSNTCSIRGDRTMNMPVLKLDPEDVTMAMSDQTTEWLLDPVTGKLCMDPGEADLMFGSGGAEAFAPSDPERVLPIPDFHSSDGYEIMEAFALKQVGSKASRHLLAALEKRKPFRQFKRALDDFPEDRRRWFEFEVEEMKRIAENFYEAEGYDVRWIEPPAS